MRFHKTARAREALSNQGHALSQAERRILILCDGRREARQIVAMLGAGTEASLQLLTEQGFLTRLDDVAAPPPPAVQPAPASGLAGGLGKLFQRGRATPAPVAVIEHREPSTPAPEPREPSPRETAPTRPRHGRRSMAACKMYMLDMLQLQRDMEASALAVDIQTSQDEQELLDRLLGALAWLQERTKPSMFGRISERLREVLPEHALPALENALGASGEAQGEPRPGNVIDLAKRAASG